MRSCSRSWQRVGGRARARRAAPAALRAVLIGGGAPRGWASTGAWCHVAGQPHRFLSLPLGALLLGLLILPTALCCSRGGPCHSSRGGELCARGVHPRLALLPGDSEVRGSALKGSAARAE